MVKQIIFHIHCYVWDEAHKLKFTNTTTNLDVITIQCHWKTINSILHDLCTPHKLVIKSQWLSLFIKRTVVLFIQFIQDSDYTILWSKLYRTNLESLAELRWWITIISHPDLVCFLWQHVGLKPFVVCCLSCLKTGQHWAEEGEHRTETKAEWVQRAIWWDIF